MMALVVLVTACLVGIIPELGPQLVLVQMYLEGIIPFSTLMAALVVHDGHGMLPMLAHSRRAFAAVKIVTFTLGLLVGLVGYFAGW